MKKYVTERIERTVDGDKLKIIEVVESKPDKFKYLVWTK